jgi:hypothetical protein
MTGLTEGDAYRLIWNACKGGTYRGGLKMATEGILSFINVTLLPLIRHLEGDMNHIKIWR